VSTRESADFSVCYMVLSLYDAAVWRSIADVEFADRGSTINCLPKSNLSLFILSNKFRAKESHFSKQFIVCTSDIFPICTVSHHEDTTVIALDLLGLDILDSEEALALVEDGGRPLCDPVPSTPLLHDRQCQ
jgi:hypothetical protein